MKLAVVGATGRTGRHVVDRALARGDSVVALARRPGELSIRADRLVATAVDVLDKPSLTQALLGCDAVVSALGIGTSRSATTVYSEGVGNILAAMTSARIARVSVVSAAPVGPRTDQPALQRRVVMPVLGRFFGATYADMTRMEAVLRGSDLDWVCLRPPRLVDKPPTGTYRLDAQEPLPRTRTLTFADLADALLCVLDRSDLYRRCAYVAH